MSVHSHAAHLHIHAYLTIYLAIHICICTPLYSHAAHLYIYAYADPCIHTPHWLRRRAVSARLRTARLRAIGPWLPHPVVRSGHGGTRRRAARLERSLRTYVRIGGELPGGCNGQRRQRRLQHARVLQLDVAVLGELAEGLLQRMMAPRCDAPRPATAAACERSYTCQSSTPAPARPPGATAGRLG